ncbi:unnamed protein product [Nezara viridula]|uniref:IMD domain-containing protein n=1 Tax=Nezara viridula TaxID=85310 RepID=A0A9P0EG49_NEZVI|nr:unnamed protein product [Nezara viridula]
MEGPADREYSALGGLFQQIVSDMKNGIPLWEELVIKATKLHSCLRATISAISSYLDAFQKIADLATNTRGATKEIGTALTRICLRHKAVEARMKTFTSAIMDCLVIPLQEKLEDWKKTLVSLDKEHAKDYKRARTELKKRSTDTLRLQKKAKKSSKGDLQRQVECSLKDVYERKQILEEIEKKAVRSALVEERSRFCLLVAFLKPVVNEEVAMLSELSHLQEVLEQLEKHTTDPHILPAASEQVIDDLKNSEGWTFKTPPSSPGSLGSRKSSMCSISSLNSSSSGSSKSHPSPSHHHWHRSLSQVSSSLDQNSCIYVNKLSISTNNIALEQSNMSVYDTTTEPSGAPLSVHTTYKSEVSLSRPCSPLTNEASGRSTPVSSVQPSTIVTRPPIPNRCSSLERPVGPSIKEKSLHLNKHSSVISTGGETMLPMYVNMSELANLAATKAQEMHFPPPPSTDVKESDRCLQEKAGSIEKDCSTSESSLESSSGYGSQTIQSGQEEMSRGEGIPSGILRNSLLRHGSIHLKKPPPPIRRTSSISVSVRTSQFNLSNFSRGSSGSLENLPPPPAYLLEGSPDANRYHNSYDVSKRNSDVQKANLYASEYQRKVLKTSVKDLKVSSMYETLHGSSVNVAETVRALTELNHTPASPVSVRRSHSVRSQSADRKVEPSLIAAISAKLAPSRKQDSSCNKAIRIRQWIAGRTLPDPKICHDSLMDQIKKGTVLRKTRTVNDRSAPRLFY